MTKIPYDIIVPSKGRPNGSTFAFLARAKLPYIVVIEGEEKKMYEKVLQHATFWVLPRSGQGIGFSRAYILERALRPFVMLDDDLAKFGKRVRGHASLKPISIARFLDAGWKRMAANPGLGMLGYKHGTFAIPEVRLTSSSATLAHIVFIRPDVLRIHGIRYDAQLRVFEDIDIIFQCAREGVAFERLNHYIYFTRNPSGTSQEGGIDYSGSLKQRFLDVMTKRYPGWIIDNHATRVSDKQPSYQIAWENVAKKRVEPTR